MHLYEFIKLFESYKQALAKYTNEGGNKEEVKRYLESYKDLYNRNVLPDDEKLDISQRAAKDNWIEFKTFVDKWSIAPTERELNKGEKPDKSEYAVIAGDSNWNVVVPYSHKASRYLGKKSNWCTTKPGQHFNDYVYKNGDTLIYALHKDPKEQDNGKMAAIRYNGSSNNIKEIRNKNNGSISKQAYKALTGFDVDEMINRAERLNVKKSIEHHKKIDISSVVDNAIKTNQRATLEQEKAIARHPTEAVKYAIHFSGGKRWRPAERAILRDINAIKKYIEHIIKGRWPEAEPVIMKSPESAYNYAKKVINKDTPRDKPGIRWPEAEPAIMKDPEVAYIYAANIIKGRWPEGEPAIMKDPGLAYDYANEVINKDTPRDKPGIRWPEAEPAIMKFPGLACIYARDVIKGRWPEGEPTIMKTPEVAYDYAKEVINKDTPRDKPGIRWPEAEPTIMKKPEVAYLYANEVIEDRWPEAEPYIMKDPLHTIFYAKDVIKGRWPEFEKLVQQNKISISEEALAHYNYEFPDTELEDYKNKITNLLDYAAKYEKSYIINNVPGVSDNGMFTYKGMSTYMIPYPYRQPFSLLISFFTDQIENVLPGPQGDADIEEFLGKYEEALTRLGYNTYADDQVNCYLPINIIRTRPYYKELENNK